MTPHDLDHLLDVLRKHRVASAEVPLFDDKSLKVVFEPDLSEPMPGDKPTPGGWKSPERLDNPQQFDEVP